MRKSVLLPIVALFLLFPCKAQGALKFDTTDDEVSFVSNIQLATYTVSCWVVLQTTGSLRIIWSEDGGTGGGQFGINATGSWFYRPTSAATIDQSIPHGAPNTWVHLAVTKGLGGKVDLYVNGGTANRLFTDTAIPGSVNVVKLGSAGTGVRHLGGLIEDFRIYNRVLSTTEIESLGKSRSRILLTDGLVGWWPLNEGEEGAVGNGASVKNRVSGNVGTIAGGAIWRMSTALSNP